MRTIRLLSIITVIFCSMQYAFCGSDHVWLRVDGRYLETSPYADPSGEIFYATGMAWNDEIYGGTDAQIAAWLKSKGCNVIRLGFTSLPLPTSKNAQYANVALLISNYLTPKINALKDEEIYSYLDMHEFFRRYKAGDGWLPTGDLWNASDRQAWIDDWVDLVTEYKNEPWLAGYELCNEVNVGDATYSGIADPNDIREAYLECAQAVRALDKRHILFLGNHNFAHAIMIEPVWGAVNLRPDEPYNQVLFIFHEYTRAYNPVYVAPVIDDLWERFDAPLFCTEFGYDTVTAAEPSVGEKLIFEMDMYNMMRPRKIGSSIWRLQGSYPNFSGPRYEQAWVQELPLGSVIPSTGTVPTPSAVLCRVFPKQYVYADGASTFSVCARICDSNENTLFLETSQITFSISGDAAWEDGTTADKAVAAVEGVAMVTAKSGTTAGTATISAAVSGISTSGQAVMPVNPPPASITITSADDMLPSDGTSLTMLTATILDASGDPVTCAEGTVEFSVSGPAYLYVTASEQGSTRDIADAGKTYIYLKSGSVPGTVTVTAAYGSCSSSIFSMEVVQAPQEAVASTAPNPFRAGNGNNLTFFGPGIRNATIRIYTLSGELIRTLVEPAGNYTIDWDGTNESGDMLTSGMYLYTTDSTDRKNASFFTLIK